jgi:hypothetical protein
VRGESRNLLSHLVSPLLGGALLLDAQEARASAAATGAADLVAEGGTA